MTRNGLRVGEALAITVKQAKKRQPYITEFKNKSKRRIFIGKKLRAKLMNHVVKCKLSDNDYVFARYPGGRPPSRSTIWKHYKKTAEAHLGYSEHISPHSGRHTYIEIKKKSEKKTVSAIQKKLGHKNLSTTLTYLHAVELDEQRKDN